MKAKLTPAKEKFLQIAIDGPDAEFAEIAKKLRDDYAAGLVLEAPRRWDQCQSWLDAWLYIYRRVDLDHDNHMSHDRQSVTFAVWVGPDFNDKVVGWLERFQSKLGSSTGLSHLRLVGTRVSASGIARLRALLPHTIIEEYSYEDSDRDSSLLYPPGKFDSPGV